MESLKNLDLLSVGIAVAGILILGFTIFINNKKSITNKTFFLFSIITVLWGVINYSNYQIDIKPEIAFWFLRATVFLGIWHSFSFMQLAYVFPEEKKKFPSKYLKVLLPIVAAISLITLTPLVFNSIAELSATGRIVKVNNGPAIPIFALSVLVSVAAGLFILIKKTLKSTGLEKKQFGTILFGAGLTFLLLMTFNFVLPAFFGHPEFIPFGAIFLFPFIAFSFYAIARHKLLNIKVITTEIITFILATVTLLELILANNLVTRVLRFGIFSLILGFGILLIRSVMKEVEQREELQKLTEQLKKANTQLESLSRFKTQILSFASHQIKAPLAIIKQFASILAEGLYGPVGDKVKETLNKMKNSSDELIDLINTLLDLRKVEEGRMEYKFETIKLKDLVQGSFDNLKLQADGKKLEFTFTSGYEGNVSADPQKLKQVIQNLIENSIKYTPAGFVRVATKEEGDSVIFSVSDSGLGISPTLLPNLFSQEFVRDERIKREIKGTGLGLYIAQSIVTAHNGKIWAESEGDNKGSQFYVKLKRI